MLKILVTGGAGFVGTHLTRSLLAQNHAVTVFDDLSNSAKKTVSALRKEGARVVEGDIRNYDVLSRVVIGFDAVVHLAAKINVSESVLCPQLYHDVNVTGTVNLLRACIKNKARNLIAASSAAIYGNPRILPIKENFQAVPLSPYGATKLALEHYVRAFSNSYSINAISLRFFNIYGKGQSLEYAGVIKKFLDSIHGSRPLVIYGNGKNTRDFVSIDDVVHSILLSIKKIEGKRGDVYNIASGNSMSINNLARLMVSLSGKKLRMVHKKAIKGDIKHSKASINLAGKDLGYFPRITIEKGLAELIGT